MPTRDDVLATARLARLTLSAAEVQRMQRELEDILKHVDALRHVAGSRTPAPTAAARADRTGNVGRGDPTRQADQPDASDPAPLRPDVPGPDPLSSPPSYFAPDWRDGFFTVPRLPTHD